MFRTIITKFFIKKKVEEENVMENETILKGN